MAAAALGTNWSGNYAYRADALHRPQTLEELQELVGGAAAVRVLGSRHSFTSIADSAALVALDGLPGEIVVDSTAETVTLPGHTTYAALAEALNRGGLALENLASLPHISVAGAIATGTHGSGVRKGNLATAVRAIEMVLASGELVTLGRADPDFEGAVIGLGALGAVTRVTLAVQPFYEMRQRVFEGVSWETLFDRLDEIFGAGDSVSVFHLCGARTEQVWVKRRVDDGGADGGAGSGDGDLEELLGVRAATAELHPVLGGDPVNCTEQQGVPGPWSERLPHFRSGFLPSSGEELQSEFFVARTDAVAAIEAIRASGAGDHPAAPDLRAADDRRRLALAEPASGARLRWRCTSPGAGSRPRWRRWSRGSRPLWRRMRPAPTGARCSRPAPTPSPRCTRGWRLS